MTTFLSSSNLSLYTVPVAWWLCMAPHLYAIERYRYIMNSASTDSIKPGTKKQLEFDRTQPRTFLSRLEANPHPALTPELKTRLARAEAASLNGYENLGFFAASVVAANISLIVVHANEGQSFSKELYYVNCHCLGYLASRILFSWSYVEGARGPHRGVYFYTGLACASALFIHAGNALRKLVK
ncbi:uncharacterized protein HMPREF1541_00719 [Cyphellophora europaea CBS 101466]|uniref:MAPEG family protein n=1 Tax=Cyphellophora europaea (strain CBS 101466) TaxID=1220924 RepID=W2SF62_CYPE1|nr:uncharacterized protein HMPREF1541_00719 [Cyphellophora europaea CBS 101466]ETN46534.1 hypothetical protein HMPREF1541_00719 [Cyphellophora europaea CBS 101466]